MSRLRIRNIVSAAIGLIVIGFYFSACKQDSKATPDTYKSGTIYISVDESFKPVMEEQIKVFEKTYPEAHIKASYKTEADCFRDLYSDTTNRMVIVTRGLTREEDNYFLDTLRYAPAWDNIANDAIVVIVNRANNDTLYTLDKLKKQLTGQVNRNQKIVFDGLNATSTVRFTLDSILKGQKFDTSVVQAVSSSKEVIDYVSKTESAIGFVGISWIGNPEDSAQVNMLKKVKIAYVACEVCEDTPFVKPLQASISTRRYPLVRGLYYILKENYSGLGRGFVNFLNQERGQLIFKRAYLGTRMDFEVRKVKINE